MKPTAGLTPLKNIAHTCAWSLTGACAHYILFADMDARAHKPHACGCAVTSPFSTLPSPFIFGCLIRRILAFQKIAFRVLASRILASRTLASRTLASRTLASRTLASGTLASWTLASFGSQVSGSRVFWSRVFGSRVFGSGVFLLKASSVDSRFSG